MDLAQVFSPDAYDKEGPKWYRSSVDKMAFLAIVAGNYFHNGVRKMEKDMKKANEALEAMTEDFQARLSSFVETKKSLDDNVKQATGRIKDSAQKLGDSISKIEKSANFNKLEHMVELLERADRAFSNLAELEDRGKLDKIAAVLK